MGEVLEFFVFAAAPAGVGGRGYAGGPSTPRPGRAPHVSAPGHPPVRRLRRCVGGEHLHSFGHHCGVVGNRIDASTPVDGKGKRR